MKISLLAALGRNRVIGFENRLPWHLPDDMKRFRETTTGHSIVMGRRTFESVGNPLPDRNNIVLSRQAAWSARGVEVASDPEAALAIATRHVGQDLYVIGGEAVYKAFLDRASELLLTRVETECPGDAYFPTFDETGGPGSAWRRVSEDLHAADERHAHGFRFERWLRAPAEPGGEG